MEGAPSAQLFRPATLGSSLSPPLHPPHLSHQHVLCSVHLGNTSYSNRWTPDVRGLMPSKFKIGVPLGDPLQCVSPAPPTPWLCPCLKTCLVFATPWSAAHQASLSFTTPLWASRVAQLVKNLPAMQETWVQLLGQADPLEKGWATHSSRMLHRLREPTRK